MDDGYNLTLHGLLRKRGELTSEVDALRAQLGEKMAALDHIDATIRVFKPDIDIEDMPERPAPPPNAAFRGEVQRFLLHTLTLRWGTNDDHAACRGDHGLPPPQHG